MVEVPITIACGNYDRTRALMDGRVKVGLLHRPLQVADQRAGDAVPALRTVEGQPGDAACDLVEDRRHYTGRARSMIALASIPSMCASASSCTFMRNEPSPSMSTTCLSGKATFAPIAAG